MERYGDRIRCINIPNVKGNDADCQTTSEIIGQKIWQNDSEIIVIYNTENEIQNTE